MVLTDLAAFKVVLEAGGRAKCPECGDMRKCGTAGLQNMIKNHVGSDKCKLIKEKREKEEKGKKWKKEDGSILTFMKAKVPLNPSTVKDSLPVKALQLGPGGGGNSSTPAEPAPVSVVERLRFLTAKLPDHIPEAAEDDSLAILSRDPMEYDDLSVDRDDLWEEVLNPLLKRILGWGEEGDTENLIRRGEKGMGALLRFVEYFIFTRGVDAALFEGKLSYMMNLAEKL
ncbi:hypothetical protein BDN72DRAFT_939867 [Pluteus cervinus]|uniref:Uncharacterized protein n=1 Tax=Pluteus cervinus TaxID=181527 RepID=A0ACD3AY37_9AGAR|nr:hypothetical protein BDN72DRAFT_939867 [Pluteus cervinus]